ncbi:hypothetical protein BJ166DRAFT_12728 [Pestalotiopsis sp. NC0098]|nr:hypothetical protein BJ166DRAFT_12728 [Pestalotiopsis sp. NC0098]
MAASPPGKKRGLVALGKPVSPRVFSLPAASKANGRDGLLHPNAMPPSHGNFDWPCSVGVTDGSGDNMKQFMACYFAHLTTITPTIYYISERFVLNHTVQLFARVVRAPVPCPCGQLSCSQGPSESWDSCSSFIAARLCCSLISHTHTTPLHTSTPTRSAFYLVLACDSQEGRNSSIHSATQPSTKPYWALLPTTSPTSVDWRIGLFQFTHGDGTTASNLKVQSGSLPPLMRPPLTPGR